MIYLIHKKSLTINTFKSTINPSHDEVIVRVARTLKHKYFRYFLLVFHLRFGLLFALYFLWQVWCSSFWTLIVHHLVEVRHCLLQPHEKYVPQYDVLEKPHPEVRSNLSLYFINNKRVNTIHRTLFHFSVQVPMQTLDHALTTIELQVQLVEMRWYLVNRHICLVMFLDVFESFGHNFLDVSDNVRNWLLKMGLEKLLDLGQFFSTNLLEILLLHLFAFVNQVYLEPTYFQLFYTLHPLQTFRPWRLLSNWFFAIWNAIIVKSRYFRGFRGFNQAQTVHRNHDALHLFANLLTCFAF